MLIDVAGVWDQSAEIPIEAATYIASAYSRGSCGASCAHYIGRRLS